MAPPLPSDSSKSPGGLLTELPVKVECRIQALAFSRYRPPPKVRGRLPQHPSTAELFETMECLRIKLPARTAIPPPVSMDSPLERVESSISKRPDRLKMWPP